MSHTKLPPRSEFQRCGKVYVHSNYQQYLIICDKCDKEFTFFSFFTQHRLEDEECIKEIATETTEEPINQNVKIEPAELDMERETDLQIKSNETTLALQSIENEKCINEMATETSAPAAVNQNVKIEPCEVDMETDLQMESNAMSNGHTLIDNSFYKTVEIKNEIEIVNSPILDIPSPPQQSQNNHCITIDNDNNDCHPKIIKSVNKQYSCDICDKSYNFQTQLIFHQRIHTGERPFKCDKCTKSFERKNELSAHEKTHASNVCNICGKKFYDHDNGQFKFELHKLKHHNEKELEKIHKKFHCDTCDRFFKNINKFNLHCEKHLSDLVCEFCDRKFSNARTMRMHKERKTCIQRRQREKINSKSTLHNNDLLF